ncbi:Phosphatidate phosphatase [Bertholletia excelsa]
MSAAPDVAQTTMSTPTVTFPVLSRLQPQFPPSKLIFYGDFVSRRPVTRHIRARRPNTMTGSIATSAFRSDTGNEDIGALEQESFITRSSPLRPNFVAVGLESTLNRVSKWTVTALVGVVILWRHDAEALWAAMGSIINTLLSVALKKILNQERPFSTQRSDPGMPSSHAQSTFFAVIFLIISMVQWLGMNGLTLTLSCLAMIFGSCVSWLRVSQQLHTISQVLVGAVLGLFFSILWFWSWDAAVMKAFTSYLWVRIAVLLGAAGSSVGFLIYIIRYWIVDNK